jgi:predicted alpha/beta superfamily hydrolase
MKKIYFIWCCLILFGIPNYAQHQYLDIDSDILQDNRKFKLQLPRSYESNPDKEYPIILVLDADYLFEPVGGMVDYLSYWEEIPEAIVVGIMQGNKRNDDFFVDEPDFLPVGSGESFFDFIELELISYIENNYRTTPLRIIVGHGESANFSNFFLFRQDPLFRAYINFSPFFTPKMKDRVASALSRTSSKTWYYYGYSSNEPISKIREMKDFGIEAELIENPNLTFYKKEFENSTHFTSISQGIGSALENIFSVYKPITPQEYDKSLYHAESPVAYLEEKYYNIAEFFNLEIAIRINDLMFASQAIEAKKNWEEYQELAKLAKKHQPKKLLSEYFLARYHQEIGNPKKALKHYQDAYGYEPVGQLTQDLMLIRAEEIKEVFGY